jgi:predicted DNA-binding ribbon-helix-helix protein
MKSLGIKRSVIISCHKTSVCLEDAFWKGLKEIASARNRTMSDLIASIDEERKQSNLSSALRLFILDFYCIRLAKPAASDKMTIRSASAA